MNNEVFATMKQNKQLPDVLQKLPEESGYIGVSASRIRVWDHISSHLQEADYFIVFEDDEVWKFG